MKLNDILEKIHDGFDGYATESKARLRVARDPFDVLEILFAGPQGLLLIFNYAGGERSDEAEISEAEENYPIARERIEIVVGHGANIDPASEWKLLLGNVDRAGLLERVSDVRARALSLVFPEQGESLQRLEYQGCAPVETPNGLPLAAYRLTFSLLAQVEVDADTELD